VDHCPYVYGLIVYDTLYGWGLRMSLSVSLCGLSLSSRRDAEKPYHPIPGPHAMSRDKPIICVSLKDYDVGLSLYVSL